MMNVVPIQFPKLVQKLESKLQSKIGEKNSMLFQFPWFYMIRRSHIQHYLQLVFLTAVLIYILEAYVYIEKHPRIVFRVVFRC